MGKREGFLFFLVLILTLSACMKEEAILGETIIDKDLNRIDKELLNEYNIDLQLDYEDKSYRAKQVVNYVNNSGKT